MEYRRDFIMQMKEEKDEREGVDEKDEGKRKK